MNAFHRHPRTFAAIVLTTIAAILGLPMASSAAEPAVDQYRSGVAGAGGDTPTTEFGGDPASQGNLGADAEAAAAATAPDFNVVRNDTDGGGSGGVVFLIAVGASLVLTLTLLNVRRRSGSGSTSLSATATHSPRQG